MAAYQLPLQASWRAVRPPKLHVDGAVSHTHDGLAVCDCAQLGAAGRHERKSVSVGRRTTKSRERRVNFFQYL